MNHGGNMAASTAQQQQLLEMRRRHYKKFIDDSRPALRAFVAEIAAENADYLLQNLGELLDPLDDFLRNEEFDEDLSLWVSTRLAYVVGGYLQQAFKGQWALDETPDSETFAKIVMRVPFEGRTITFDVPDLALRVATAPPPRSLFREMRLLLAYLDADWPGPPR